MLRIHNVRAVEYPAVGGDRMPSRGAGKAAQTPGAEDIIQPFIFIAKAEKLLLEPEYPPHTLS